MAAFLHSISKHFGKPGHALLTKERRMSKENQVHG
jgi:hypothetical protein